MTSIPLKMLHEALGQEVTVELESGETFAGRVVSIEDNMNIQLQDVTHKYRSGKERKVANVYLRGSNIVFFELPPGLKAAPAFAAALQLTSGLHQERGGGRGFASAGRGFGASAGRGFGASAGRGFSSRGGRGGAGRGRGGGGEKRARED